MAYSARSNVEDIFGVSNVHDWADLDNDDNASNILARINRAIAVADAQIDDYFRGLFYVSPIQNASAATPTSIVDLSACLAGLWLHNCRGYQHNDRSYDDLAKQVWRELKAIRLGIRKIDAV